MARPRTAWLLSGLLSLAAAGGLTAAPPPAAAMLQFRPKQENVAHSTPAAAALPACKVELVKGTGRASGWLLRDPQGQPLRRFFDSNGDNKIDIWSYYADGQEVYREVDSNFDDKADQYRWLGANGSRWGADLNGDGRIDGWRAISAEEASQEVLQAVVKRDFARLQALMITDAELQSLDLPEAEAARVRDSLSKAQAKFQQTVAASIGLGEKTTWVHLETPPPQCTPSDAGSKPDLLRYKYGTVLYENGGKADWMQTGEMLLVGRAWRLIDAPVPGARQETGPANVGEIAVSADIKPDVEALQDLDKKTPATADPAQVVKHNMDRAAILERIAAKGKPDQREQWLRQVADCYSAAAQSTVLVAQGAPLADNVAYQKLLALRDQAAREPAMTKLLAYVTFREMSAEYSAHIADREKSKEPLKLQEGWLVRLRKFVEDFPAAEEAPEAHQQLAMVSEFLGKESDAKNWYNRLVKNFPEHAVAAKASGALSRLDLEGKELILSALTLGTNAPFDMGQVRGKVTVVYYWASNWNTNCAADFAKMKQLLNTYAPKGVELVTVNLDGSAGDALKFLQANPAPGTHLYQQPGGLDGTLAKQYGIMVLPNLFLVDREGKVVSRTVQMNNLEDEVKKLAK